MIFVINQGYANVYINYIMIMILTYFSVFFDSNTKLLIKFVFPFRFYVLINSFKLFILFR